MKILILFITLIIAVVISSSSYAGWTKVSTNNIGDTFYVDFERIRKHDGYAFFWRLVDHLKPIQGFLSSTVCIQGDCKLFRLQYLSLSYHKKPMGGGANHQGECKQFQHKYLSLVSHKEPMISRAGDTHNYKNPEWFYPPPDTSIEYVLKLVCSK